MPKKVAIYIFSHLMLACLKRSGICRPFRTALEALEPTKSNISTLPIKNPTFVLKSIQPLPGGGGTHPRKVSAGDLWAEKLKLYLYKSLDYVTSVDLWSDITAMEYPSQHILCL